MAISAVGGADSFIFNRLLRSSFFRCALSQNFLPHLAEVTNKCWWGLVILCCDVSLDISLAGFAHTALIIHILCLKQFLIPPSSGDAHNRGTSAHKYCGDCIVVQDGWKFALLAVA